jgi:hypothetical protein
MAKNNFKFEPGRYVLAGVPQNSDGTPNPVLSMTQNASVTDFTDVGQYKNANAGEIFILTDYKYMNDSGSLPGGNVFDASELAKFKQGYVDLQGGSGDISLHGLDPNAGAVKDRNLNAYGQILLWQDRRNSTVAYYSETPGVPKPATDGHIDCGSYGNGDMINTTACDNDPAPDGVDLATNPSSPVFRMQGSPKFQLYGILYQPRGGMYYVPGGGAINGYFQVITGAALLWGDANFVSLGSPQFPLTRIVATLVK